MAKILVVEDDVDFALTVEHALTTSNHTVEMAHDGESAMEYLRQGQYDVIILDGQLPDIDGIELTRKLRERDVDIPVVLFTGYPDRAFSAKAASVGVRHILYKPHLGENLISQVRAAIRRRDAGRQ